MSVIIDVAGTCIHIYRDLDRECVDGCVVDFYEEVYRRTVCENKIERKGNMCVKSRRE